jgi:adenosine deaminase
MSFYPNNKIFADLHNHLYGSIPASVLYQIGKKNPNPRWNLFLDSYESAFGKKIRPETFFEEYSDLEKFEELYYFQNQAPFAAFQAKFNLIIALVKYDLLEMREIAELVTIHQAKSGVALGEYRVMFSIDEPRQSMEERILWTCEGLKKGEESAGKILTSKTDQEIPVESNLVVSLHRSKNFEIHYEWIKELMEKDSLVREKLVGIDFCHVEEGNPPKAKKDFFAAIRKDNQEEPKTALSILYHVGESYTDKSPFSATRWILESADYGAHRLGHCLAMGISSEHYRGGKYRELVSERYDQRIFERNHLREIQNNGNYLSPVEIENEISKLKNLQRDSYIVWDPTEKELEYLETFLQYARTKIADCPAVVESCPSSNLYIGMIRSIEEHPLPRFLSAGIKTTVSTDDPGIFNTSIIHEYQKAKQMNLPTEALEKIREESFSYRSEILSGRWNEKRKRGFSLT